MVTNARLTQLEDSLREAQARINALGTLQIAMAHALEDALPDYSQQVTKALDNMRRRELAEGKVKEAALLNGLIKEFHEQLGSPAND